MGQSPSTAAISSRRETTFHSHRFKPKPTSPMLPFSAAGDFSVIEGFDLPDYISDLPDECLAFVFQSLGSADRKRCSLVCRRWFVVEGQSRHRLSLNAQLDLLPMIPSLFSRFDAVTKLALKCDRRSVSIGDDALALISLRCRNLTRLKLRACRELTDAGMAEFAKNCKALKKLSCGSCTFGAIGMNAVLDNCSALEELSVKRLRGITDGAAAEPIGPGVAAKSLKTICLKELYNGQCFGPLIIGSKNLKTLKLFRCSGDWDKLLQLIADRVTGMVEVHLERLQVSDFGLAAISNCLDLEILHIVKTPECTNVGLVSVAERCKLLRKLHIDGWKANRIGDEGLCAVAKYCPNLQELVLIGVNPTKLSLEMLASNCPNLERLALCGSDTVGDAEISCIAAKCIALRKLCIKSCPVSDHGMEALAGGCPNLVKVKVKKCRAVTCEGADWLRASRGSLAVNLDTGEPEHQDASASDGGVQENGVEFPPVASQMALPNIKKAKFPCCLVWTPLPVVSWLAPFFGHVGICREDGSILDFTGTNFVNADDFAYGGVARYLQLDRQQCCFPPNQAGHTCKHGYMHSEFGSAITWDDALRLSTRHFESKTYNLFTCNCHSFAANCLNRLCYGGSMSWNMVSVGALILFKGHWVDSMSILRSFSPSIVVACLGVFMVGWPFLIGLLSFSLLLLLWFLLVSYCFKTIEC